MKVVIAGGSGLVGRALVAQLSAERSDVTVLSRSTRPVPDATVVRWEAIHAGAWREAFDGADAVVNLCGASVGTRPWTPRRRAELIRSRIEPTRALVEAIAAIPSERRPRALVNASGTDVYQGTDELPATEASPPADTFLGRLVLAWEAEARRAEALGVRVSLARMSLVVGPGSAAVRLVALPARLGFGGPIGDGRQWVSWIDLRDAAAILGLLTRDGAPAGPVNVCAPDAVPQAELGRILARIWGIPLRLPVPAAPLRLVLREQSALALGSRRVSSARIESAGHVFAHADLEASLRWALGRPARRPG
ncbi:MAG: TIGR01777 family oxidoreductase [Chloroflexota bacterium]